MDISNENPPLCQAVSSLATHFTDNLSEFNLLYESSRAQWRAGKAPLDKYLPMRDYSSRRFGVEIEFDADNGLGFIGCDCKCFCGDRDLGRFCGCFIGCKCEDNYFQETPIGHWLHDNGFISKPYGYSYHSGAGHYDRWRYEVDDTVSGGEVVTPVLDGNTESWVDIARVMKCIEDLGGNANGRDCGGHISIDATDIGEDQMRRLVTLAMKFEDVMYRLATNPYRAQELAVRGRYIFSSHRGKDFSLPLDEDALSQLDVYGGTPFWGNTWLSFYPVSMRLEFRIFDGTLNPALSQTWAMIANSLVEAAFRTDIDEVLAGIPDRLVGWHLSRHSSPPTVSILNSIEEEDTLTIRQFVDLLFTRKEDKERVITLFAANDWNRR